MLRALVAVVVVTGCGARPVAPGECDGPPGTVAPSLLARLGGDARLGPGDQPGDLAAVPNRRRVRLERLRTIVVAPLVALLEAAEADGVRLWVGSGFRGYCRQRALHAEGPATEVAAPGLSEHQLGTAVDLVAGPATMLEAGTEAYAWMDAHAWRFGFVNSYPPQDDASDDRTFRYTGIEVEPWHWRYVGDDAAARHHDHHVATGIRLSSAELIDTMLSR